MANISGTNDPNVLKDTSNDPSSNLYGYGGNDTLFGLANADYLFGGDGKDKLYGGVGDDWLMGGKGADRLDGGTGVDGASYYSTSGVTASLDGSLKGAGEAAGDTYFSIEKMEGSNTGADKLSGDAHGNTIWSYGGNDTLLGRAGDDWLIGGAGADKINGGAGIDGASFYQGKAVTMSLDGSLKAKGEARGDTYVSIENLEGSGTGGDMLSGDAKANRIWGQGGADTLYGRAGADTLYGGDGADKLFGGDGDDFLRGGAGADTFNGGAGKDATTYFDAAAAVTVALDGSLTATGEARGDIFVSIENIGGTNFADTLSGNAQANLISGQGGNDRIYGRGGDDSFYFTDKSEGTDTIMDFALGDKVTFENQAFGNLAAGPIQTGWFITASDNVARDNNDYFIFNQTDHSLWYDSDGSGTTAAIKLAIFQNTYALQFTDLKIIDLF